jgi:hypothetical protein
MEEKIMKRLTMGLIVSMVCVLARPTTTPAEEPAEKVLKPCVAITGADSHITEPRCQRITSADDWTRVWQEHKGQTPSGKYDLYDDPLTLPLIDFDRYMVIAIFQGNGWNSAGLKAVSITDADNRTIFRLTGKGYQTGGPDGGGKKVAAYGFFIVPRFAKPVVLEENAQQYLGEPPVWKERITFPGLASTP